MYNASITCVVTIHGVGFQQPPSAGQAGYADQLHAGLAAALGPDVRLGDDPRRAPYQVGDSVPIYVSSEWPPDRPVQERGVERVGTWVAGPGGTFTIDTSTAPLVTGDARVAHVALVYTGLEERGHDPAAVLAMATLGLAGLGRYGPAGALPGLLWRSASGLLPRRGRAAGSASPSLAVRRDRRTLVTRAARRPGAPDRGSVLIQIESDMAAYVVRNERRELVRGFVEEVLLRLLARDDVGHVVVNAHSHGTAVAFDVARRLPRASARRVGALVTAGSPLRKYSTMLSWGSEIGTLRLVPSWVNFYDPHDPVADALAPPAPGSASPGSLFCTVDPDTGATRAAAIEDRRVDNVAHCPAGPLAAHNYWDNTAEFVPALAGIVRDLASEPSAARTPA
ncbi:MAG TPA: hypothetical protein VFA92_06510 [Candidatus Binatia bacterium]|nr:hypothetical protein [Candidatus Binatia bacterium]